jgi:RecG-like helicase
MTATPIPRTLGQVLYADLDVTDLRTPPEGRVRIRTGIREPNALDSTWQKVRDEAALGHRTFVVVPLITPADAAEADLDDEPETLGSRRAPPRRLSPPSPRPSGCASCWHRSASGSSTAA